MSSNLPISSSSEQDDDDAIDIRAYDDVRLAEMVADDVCEGYTAEVTAAIQELFRRQWSPLDILSRALLPGLKLVDEQYQQGSFSASAVSRASKTFKTGLTLVRQQGRRPFTPPVGRVMLAGVWGDAHTFGLDICEIYLQQAGFDVRNLGNNIRESRVLMAVRKHKPDVLVLSTMLTTTRRYLRITVDALEDNGLRHEVYILIGGRALVAADADRMGADGFCADWNTAVDLVRAYLKSDQT